MLFYVVLNESFKAISFVAMLFLYALFFMWSYRSGWTKFICRANVKELVSW